MNGTKPHCYLAQNSPLNYQVHCLTFIFAQSDIAVLFEKNEFLFHEYSQDTVVWKYCAVCL